MARINTGSHFGRKIPICSVCGAVLSAWNLKRCPYCLADLKKEEE